MNWRLGLIVGTVLIAVFGIPLLPRTHSHLIYWAFAFVLEVALLTWLKPNTKRINRP